MGKDVTDTPWWSQVLSIGIFVYSSNSSFFNNKNNNIVRNVNIKREKKKNIDLNLDDLYHKSKI
jgi:hypothetical protein